MSVEAFLGVCVETFCACERVWVGVGVFFCECGGFLCVWESLFVGVCV